MHAIVVVEAKDGVDLRCRIVDGSFEGALSPPIALRFEDAALEDDSAFLTGRAPRSLPDVGSYVAFGGVSVAVSPEGAPSLVARSLADLVAVTSPGFTQIAWGHVEQAVAAEAMRNRPDEGIVYVDAGGTAFVVDSVGPYLHAPGREDLRTARECGLDGAEYPTAAGFYHFAGEPWSFQDPSGDDVEHAWGMTVSAYVPLTDAHLAAFGRTSADGLAALVAQRLARVPAPSL
jgi:hypothetical protein